MVEPATYQPLSALARNVTSNADSNTSLGAVAELSALGRSEHFGPYGQYAGQELFKRTLAPLIQ